MTSSYFTNDYFYFKHTQMLLALSFLWQTKTFWLKKYGNNPNVHRNGYILYDCLQWNSEKVNISHSIRSHSLWPPGTVARQAPPSMGFSRQEYWNRLLFPCPGDLPNPGNEPRSPALQGDSSPSELMEQYSPINRNVGLMQVTTWRKPKHQVKGAGYKRWHNAWSYLHEIFRTDTFGETESTSVVHIHTSIKQITNRTYGVTQRMTLNIL